MSLVNDKAGRYKEAKIYAVVAEALAMMWQM